MHGELNELRRALKLQEDIQARTRSELEAARLAHQGLRQPSSSMPMSSRTTDSGWEYMSRDRAQAFPIGADIRSPEVRTPSHRSSVNREVYDFAGTAQPTPSLVTEETAPERFAPRVEDQAHERLAQCATSSASSPEKDTTTSNDARAVRDRQLRELLMSVGMTGRSSSSSTSATKGVSYDGNRASGFALANVVAGETKPVAPPKTISRIRNTVEEIGERG